MSKQIDKNLFMFSSMPGLYQRLLNGISDYHQLGNRIIKEIKAAHAFRRIDEVRELSGILLNFPLKEYQLIGQYYLAWCECRESKYDNGAVERVIEQSSAYKTKALLSRGTFDLYKGSYASALYFYAESFKSQPTISEYIEAMKSVAVIKSIEGFHESALKDLESIIPFIHHAEPFAYYDVLNSYAVELNELGRKQEARNVSRVVLASPFIYAYPEWQETGKETGLVGCKSPHSFVPIESDVTTRPEPEPIIKPESKPEKADVLSFPRLQEAPPPEMPDKVTPEEISRMSISEKRELIQAALNSGMIPEREYTKLIVMFGLLDAGPAANVIDLEDDALLDDIIVVWANEINPEELAAVMSALRDCDDKPRRNDIIDRIIRKAFEQSRICGLTEEEWRLEVECKLPIK